MLSQHHSLKPEPEVTGPQDSIHTIPEALDSEAARVRKVWYPPPSAYLGMSLAKLLNWVSTQRWDIIFPEYTCKQSTSRKHLTLLNAACCGQELAGALDFSGSSKPGLPTQLQSFSQEIAPKGTVSSQDLAKYCPTLPSFLQYVSVAVSFDRHRAMHRV